MAANAGLIITDVNVSLFTEGEGTDEISLDVDGNGSLDYRFFATVDAGGFRSTGVDGINGNLIYGDVFGGFNKAHAYLTADITPGPTTPGGFFLFDKKTIDKKGDPAIKQKGEWPNNLATSQFLGILFSGNGGTYQGWVEVSAELGSAGLNIGQMAFDDVPIDTPEPSSMALLLLGASGVAVLKRRNRAA